jgi:hypothetical protein
VPGKLDPQAQQEFIAYYEQLKKTKGENDPIYFGDAVHPQYNSIPSYGWIRRGRNCGLMSVIPEPPSPAEPTTEFCPA